jgi:hypothetical protein
LNSNRSRVRALCFVSNICYIEALNAHRVSLLLQILKNMPDRDITESKTLCMLSRAFSLMLMELVCLGLQRHRCHRWPVDLGSDSVLDYSSSKLAGVAVEAHLVVVLAGRDQRLEYRDPARVVLISSLSFSGCSSSILVEEGEVTRSRRVEAGASLGLLLLPLGEWECWI